MITRMDWGGSPEIVRMLCAGLAREFDLTLVTGLTAHPSRKTSAFFAGFAGRVVVIPQLRREIRPWRDLMAFFKLYAFFRREKFDLVHTHTAKAGFLGRLAARLAGCRCIVHTPHGHNFYGYFGSFLSKLIVIMERLAGLVTARLVVLTELEKKDHRAFNICPVEKIALIPSALEAEFFAAPAAEIPALRGGLGLGGAQVVGMIGRLEPVKGAEFFIDAGREILRAFPATRFLVAGEGSLKQALEARAQAYGVQDAFVFTGWREDIRELLACIDVLVLPSLNEALGLVLLQAQAAGVPVVATAVGGVAEAVRDGVTGVLVAPGDGRVIAEAVARLLSDQAAAAAMGSEGRKWVSGRFTADTMVRNHELLYGELLKEAH